MASSMAGFGGGVWRVAVAWCVRGGGVATLPPNVAAQLELHYLVPGVGAVLVPLNTRLSSPSEYGYILQHCGARVVVVADEVRPLVDAAVSGMGGWARHRSSCLSLTERSGEWDLLLEGAAPEDLVLPDNEESLLSINYTSGTTGFPKGVMTTNRGAYLHSLGVIVESGLSPTSAYLWTLPMFHFHCNGWAYTWAVTAAGSLHVTPPKVLPAEVWDGLLNRGVTPLLCCADGADHDPGGSWSGQLRSAGPGVSEWRAAYSGPARADCGIWDRSDSSLRADRGVRSDRCLRVEPGVGRSRVGRADGAAGGPRRGDRGVESIRVVDEAMDDVPRDGRSLGEVVRQSNNVMAGYYRDRDATEVAFRGGWFHSGDVAVMHPAGYVEIKDCTKDVIISGGENISSVEVEQAVVAHPEVVEAAVVAGPDERWGEVPMVVVNSQGRIAPDVRGIGCVLTPAAGSVQDPEASGDRDGTSQDRHGEDPEVRASNPGSATGFTWLCSDPGGPIAPPLNLCACGPAWLP